MYHRNCKRKLSCPCCLSLVLFLFVLRAAVRCRWWTESLTPQKWGLVLRSRRGGWVCVCAGCSMGGGRRGRVKGLLFYQERSGIRIGNKRRFWWRRAQDALQSCGSRAGLYGNQSWYMTVYAVLQARFVARKQCLDHLYEADSLFSCRCFMDLVVGGDDITCVREEERSSLKTN